MYLIKFQQLGITQNATTPVIYVITVPCKTQTILHVMLKATILAITNVYTLNIV